MGTIIVCALIALVVGALLYVGLGAGTTPAQIQRVTVVATNLPGKGYRNWITWQHHGISATLDGVPVKRGFAADEVRGYVEVARVDKFDNPIVCESSGEIQFDRLYGNVVIKIEGIQ